MPSLQRLSRSELITAVFRGLDVDGDGKLSQSEMKPFATSTGFDGSDAEWGEEYRLIISQYPETQMTQSKIALPLFQQLVNDESDEGCGCTDEDLRKILADLPKPAAATSSALAQAAQFTEEEKEMIEIAGIFAHMDKNGDGRLSMKELKEVFSELGMASSDYRTLLMAADTDRKGSLDYRKFLAWIFGGSDMAKEVSSRFASRPATSAAVTVGTSSQACTGSSEAGEMRVLINRDGHPTVLIHPPGGNSASLQVPNGTLTSKVTEGGDYLVVKYDGKDWLVKKHHAVGQAEAAKMAAKAKPYKGVRCDPSIIAAAAAACEDGWDYDDDDLEEDEDDPWFRFNGSVLETALTAVEDLGESPVRLVDARFIVELAKKGGVLPRRQDAPEECFIDLKWLKYMPPGGEHGDALRIVAISHPWQQPDHPDPKGINLQILAGILSIMIDEGEGMEPGNGTYAVFLDFISVHQKGPNLEDRTKKEWRLFSLALKNMMDWYGHPKILTFKLTNLPDGYPSDFNFPKGCDPNIAGYYDRGWCFCESSVSNLSTDNVEVLDLGKLSGTKTELSHIVKECEAQRRPPLSPQQFKLELATKSFTSKRTDEEMVSNLYASTITRQFREVKELMYSTLSWGDEEMALLAQTLEAVACPKLVGFYAKYNRIGDAGCTALAKAIVARTYPKLEDLDLQRNQIGDGGCTALGNACAKGALPKLATLSLEKNRIRDAGCTALAEACAAGKLPNLKELKLSINEIGDEGVENLAEACEARQLPKLAELRLDENKFGDGGITYLAYACLSNPLPNLAELRLQRNQIGDHGCSALAKAYADGAFPKLETLYLHENLIGDRGCTAWAEACAAGKLPKLEKLTFGFKGFSKGCQKSMKEAWAQARKGNKDKLFD